MNGILASILTRLGTAVSGYLVALGAHTDLANQLVTASTAVILISADIIMSRKIREGA